MSRKMREKQGGFARARFHRFRDVPTFAYTNDGLSRSRIESPEGVPIDRQIDYLLERFVHLSAWLSEAATAAPTYEAGNGHQ